MKSPLVKELYWLAGLLEGEGCFTFGNLSQSGSGFRHPALVLDMTDKDTMEKAAAMFGTSVYTLHTPTMKKNNGKPSFRTQVTGTRAVAWMMTLYPLMGSRRQERIREILHSWRESPAKARSGLREVLAR